MKITEQVLNFPESWEKEEEVTVVVVVVVVIHYRVESNRYQNY